MAGPLLAAGLQAAGSLIGGFSRNKAAKKLKKSLDTTMLRARREVEQDQARALEYRALDQSEAAALARADEGRLRDATGFDFAKLRDDAMSAGFNPLTVLAATGGSGYDGRGAVLTTPFVSRPFLEYNDVTQEHARVVAGIGSTLVDTAGYFGDAIADGSSAYFNQKNTEQGFALEQRRLEGMEMETLLRYSPMMRSGGISGGSSSPFGAGPVTALDARPDFRLPGGLTFNGVGWGTDPGTSDSEAIETRYGDFVQALYGVGVLGVDAYRALQRTYNASKASAASQPYAHHADGGAMEREKALMWGVVQSGIDAAKGKTGDLWSAIPAGPRIPRGGLSASPEPLRLQTPGWWPDQFGGLSDR